MLDVYVDAARFYEDFSEIRTIGLDETSVAKGHDYITLFEDMEQKRTIHISDGNKVKRLRILQNSLRL